MDHLKLKTSNDTEQYLATERQTVNIKTFYRNSSSRTAYFFPPMVATKSDMTKILPLFPV